MSTKQAVSRAVNIYESFRETKPRRITSVRVTVPKAVASVGYVEAIDYRTTHGGKLTLYRHDFAKGSRPLLAVSDDGKQLLFLGGRYQFTEQGIVDKTPGGRLITNPKHGKNINPRRRVRKFKTRAAAVKFARKHGISLRQIRKSMPATRGVHPLVRATLTPKRRRYHKGYKGPNAKRRPKGSPPRTIGPYKPRAKCIPVKVRAKQLRQEAAEHLRDARKLLRNPATVRSPFALGVWLAEHGVRHPKVPKGLTPAQRDQLLDGFSHGKRLEEKAAERMRRRRR